MVELLEERVWLALVARSARERSETMQLASNAASLIDGPLRTRVARAATFGLKARDQFIRLGNHWRVSYYRATDEPASRLLVYETFEPSRRRRAIC